MYYNRLLRKQVATELKLRRYAFLTFLILSFAYLLVNLVFSDTGLLRYLQLRENRSALGEELKLLSEENEVLRSSVITYRDNNFYVEKHAREDFGLAGPDEYIFIYKK
jgi:cell division protein FtsB